MTSQSHSLDERVFFEQGPIAVTDARFIIGNETYAVRSIASVLSTEEEPKRGWAIFLTVVGLLVFVGNLFDGSWAGVAVGAVLVALAALWLYSQSSTHHVSLRTSAGTIKVLSSQDGALIRGVVKALNDAIVAQS